MIKHLLFDLDGVLFDGVEFHKQIFLSSVNTIVPELNINSEFHDQNLNGLSTKQKLTLLLSKDLITAEQEKQIENLKKEETKNQLDIYTFNNPNIKHIISLLYTQGYNMYCVTNSIKDTTVKILKGLDIYNNFKGIVTNEDIINPKPSSDPYDYVFKTYNLNPNECMILEDSHHGRCAAYKTKAHVLPIVDPLDVTLEKIYNEIEYIKSPRHLSNAVHVNIVVPMAGHGSRFSKVGYSIPKPFIPVFGKPMIQWVIENSMPTDEVYDTIKLSKTIIPHYHFIAQESHLKHYDLGKICKELNIDYTITTVDKVTEGPACTVLLTKDKINNDMPLVTINSDQFLDWDINNFYRCLLNSAFDGCINTFIQPNEKDIKWSYAKLNTSGCVTEVAEKKYISNLATTGVYGWKHGSDFVKCAEQMIAENVRVNNEFYVCPVYNWLISRGGKVRTFNCKKLWGLGVPEDLENFLQFYPGK
jgi:HAD superfamily hydrolase (TIGR01509 family)